MICFSNTISIKNKKNNKNKWSNAQSYFTILMGLMPILETT